MLAARKLFDEIDSDSNREISIDEIESWAAANQDRAGIFLPGAKDDLEAACTKFRLASDANEDNVLDVKEFTAGYVKLVVAEGGSRSCPHLAGWLTDKQMTADMAGHAAALMFDEIDTHHDHTISKKEYKVFYTTKLDEAKIFIPGFADATTDAKRKAAAKTFRVCDDLYHDGVITFEEFKEQYVTNILSMVSDGGRTKWLADVEVVLNRDCNDDVQAAFGDYLDVGDGGLDYSLVSDPEADKRDCCAGPADCNIM